MKKLFLILLAAFLCANLARAQEALIDSISGGFKGVFTGENGRMYYTFYKAPKKPGFLQKLEYKIVQKKVKRLLAHRADEPATRKNVLSTISMVLGILAILVLFIPSISVIALVAGPAALITGIIALGKKYNNSKASRAKAIIGIVLGSVFILFLLVAILFVIAGGLDFE